jgi:hypothetical protein
MTNDEIETRIARLETRLAATQVLVHTLLPATVPAARHQVLKQFGQWCAAMEGDLVRQGTSAAEQNWHLGEIAKMYNSLKGALELVEAWESKQKK